MTKGQINGGLTEEVSLRLDLIEEMSGCDLRVRGRPLLLYYFLLIINYENMVSFPSFLIFFNYINTTMYV